MLEPLLNESLKRKPILLMTHIVIGYPDLDTSLRLVEAMVEAGVDLMELQIPFSEPMADGPVIVRANQHALERGATVERCFAMAEHVTRRFDIPFLFMTYLNVLYRRGFESFATRAREAGVKGVIIPDLPPQEAEPCVNALARNELDPVFIFSPFSSETRMREIAEQARGFVYCVARKGVTGAKTQFSTELTQYLERARRATSLPLAVGFGIRSPQDVAFLVGKADIAVVGSETLRVLDRDGINGVQRFVGSLRSSCT